MSEIVTAAVLIIGNEILSGRTQDLNLSFLGTRLNEIGIQMNEARVVADDENEIVEALNALRNRYDYVFTTGGIGPTHDDITADSVAKAFGVGIDYHPQAFQAFKEYFAQVGRDVVGGGQDTSPTTRRSGMIPPLTGEALLLVWGTVSHHKGDHQKGDGGIKI